MKHIGKDLPGREAGGGHMGMGDTEMSMDMDPAMFDDAEPFDRAFVDMMVPHHEAAVAMAEQLLEDGEHRNLQAMAQNIISAQTREIASMKRWPKAWYGSARVPTDMSGHGSTDDMHMGG